MKATRTRTAATRCATPKRMDAARKVRKPLCLDDLRLVQFSNEVLERIPVALN